jgi:iron complex outermembrane recepter protein
MTRKGLEMNRFRKTLKPRAVGAAVALLLCLAAQAQTARPIDIPAGDLKTALDAYAAQTGQQLVYRIDDIQGLRSNGAKGSLTADGALQLLLQGTRLKTKRDGDKAVVVFVGEAAAAPADEAAQRIVVSGIRRGIEGAIAVKKGSDGVVEAIAAEDIGKLPDNSIADSLSRLPGVSAQRVGGKAQKISIRGTAGDLATGLLNGREQVSMSADRNVLYDQYPSELINGVTVYKSSDASVIGQGLSGTIDLQSIKPLSLRERVITFNARGEHNTTPADSSGVSRNGSRLSASYIDQFAGGTFGLAIGFAHTDQPTAQKIFNTYSWDDDNTVTPGQTVARPSGLDAHAHSGRQKRNGAMAVLEWKPSATFSSMLDVYYSQLAEAEGRRGLSVTMQSWAGPVLSNPGIVDGLMATGTAVVKPIVYNADYSADSTLRSVGWNNRLTMGAWTGAVDLSRSSAHRREVNRSIWASRGTDTMDFDYTGGGAPGLHFGNAYTDPAVVQIGSLYGSAYTTSPILDDKLDAIKLSARRTFDDGVVSSIELGLNQSRRDKQRQFIETSIPVTSPIFTSASLNAPQTGVFGVPNSLSVNVDAALANNFGPYAPSVLVPWGASGQWTITEKTSTAFFKVHLDGDSLQIPVRGNVGLQVIRTQQSSSSNTLSYVGFTLLPLTDGKSYTDVLPSLNLSWSLADDQTLRLGAGRSMARPRLDQLNASRTVGVTAATGGTPFGNGGNAQLDPWRADYLDLSWERYFGKKAYMAVQGFHKDLKSYIYDQTAPFDFSRYQFPGATTSIGPFTSPLNGKGGRLDGIELAVSAPLNMLWPALDGFGVVANASLTSSSITIKDARFGDRAVPLPGLSKRVVNLTAYYERDGFSTRLSQRYRSDYVGTIGGLGSQSILTYVSADKVVDMQLGYEFNAGTLKGLGLLLQVNNLTDSAFRNYIGQSDRQSTYQKYGRSLLLGASWKL